MDRNIAVMHEEKDVKSSCIHYWVIKSASSPVSKGICRHCGDSRIFSNYPTDCTLANTAFGKFQGDLDPGGPEWKDLSESDYPNDTTAVDGEKEECGAEPCLIVPQYDSLFTGRTGEEVAVL